MVGVFGIRGQVKVRPTTDFLERFDVGHRVRIEGVGYEIRDVREQRDNLVLTLDLVADRSGAEALVGKVVMGPPSKPNLDKDEFFTQDLIGMQVVQGERVVGVVDDVLRMPAHDVLVVGDVLIPTVRQFVKKVDTKARRIEVELIPGMIEEDESDAD